MSVRLSLMSASVVFAAGVGCGFWWKGAEPSSRADEAALPRSIAKGAPTKAQAVSPADRAEPVAAVEVISGDSGEPSPEICAAHAERRARRQAARDAKAAQRQDFMAALDPELLTAAQRERHAFYVEALVARDAARKEVSALRAAGEDVPQSLQKRLSDAESVLRADLEAEHRALREAAARAVGLDEKAVKQLVDDLASIDRVIPSPE